MRTIIVKISPSSPERNKLKEAASILKKGGLVAFPTETVYGLGANALNATAVKKIFIAKGRPADNPLIVHIANKKDACRLAKEIPKEAEKLMKKFWPGPLTIVLKKQKIVPGIVTCGLDTVGIRMPNHKIALALIKEAGPIAAPSANTSGKPSPTDASHVIEDMNGRIEMIIDGGNSRIGVESTVIDMTTKPFALLRPGGITLEQLREVLGKVDGRAVKKQIDITAPRAPGMKYKHYAPKADIIVVEGSSEKVWKKVQELVEEYREKGKRIGIITTSKSHGYDAELVKFIGNTEQEIAKKLFKSFRDFDREDIHLIIAEGVEEKGLGLAIMNRLRKAAGYNVVEVK